MYFDASPARHAAAWRRLGALGDDSQTYHGRVRAAREINPRFRDDPARLEAIAYLEYRKRSAEELLHPLPETEWLATPADIERATDEGVLQPLPDDPARLRLRLDSRLDELAPDVCRWPSLYRALRPEALALLLYLAGRVHDLGGAITPLTVTARSATRPTSSGTTPRRRPPTRYTRPATRSTSCVATARGAPAPSSASSNATACPGSDRLGGGAERDPRHRLLHGSRARPDRVGAGGVSESSRVLVAALRRQARSLIGIP
jgi:hypothetical protein